MDKNLNWPLNILNDLLDMELVSSGIASCIHSLTSREQEVMYYRYKDLMSYGEIASKIGISKERVRQIIMNSLRKLRNPRHMLNMNLLPKSVAESLKKIDIVPYHIEKLDKYDEAVGNNNYSDAFWDLDLDVRCFNCMARAGFRTVKDIIKELTNPDCRFINIRNLGVTSYNKIVKSCERVAGVDLSKYYDPYWWKKEDNYD